MSNFSLMMVDDQKKKHYGYAVKKEDAVKKEGAELKNVEYEIVTQGSDPTSIRDWKLENLAVFDMNTVKKVDNKNEIDWTNYVVFEFVATRDNDKNEELNVKMVKDGGEDGDGNEYGKVYEKDGDGFKEFELRDLFSQKIDDDGSIASSVEKEKDKDDITTPERLPGPKKNPESESEPESEKKKPEPEPKDIVLRASKLDGENIKYDLYFKFPNDGNHQLMNMFSMKFNENVTNIEVDKSSLYEKYPDQDDESYTGMQYFLLRKRKRPKIENNQYIIGTITFSDNSIQDYIKDIEVSTVDSSGKDNYYKNIPFVF